MKASPKDDPLHQLPRVQKPGQTLPTPTWTTAIPVRQETHPSHSSPAGTHISTFSSKVNWFDEKPPPLKTGETNHLFSAFIPRCLSQCYADASLQMANCPTAMACCPSWCLQEAQLCWAIANLQKMTYSYEGEGQQALHPFEGSHKPSCLQNQSRPFFSSSKYKIFFLVFTTQTTGRASARVHRTKSVWSDIHWWSIFCTLLLHFPLDSLCLCCSTAVLSISYRIQSDLGIVKLALIVAGYLL